MPVHGLGRTTCRKISIPSVHRPEFDSPPRVSTAGTSEAIYERDTWPYLEELAKNVPEAGVHFLGLFGIRESVSKI